MSVVSGVGSFGSLDGSSGGSVWSSLSLGSRIVLVMTNVLVMVMWANDLQIGGRFNAANVLLADVIYPFRAWDAHNIKNKNNVTINEKLTINKH